MSCGSKHTPQRRSDMTIGVLILKTQKLQDIYGHSTYRTTTPLSEMSIFCVRVGCQIQSKSSCSKLASECISNEPFVRTYTYNLKTIGHTRGKIFL